MTATKGPIERIREACDGWRKGVWGTATPLEDIEKACDALDEERVTLNQLTAFVVLLTDANRMTIADALDLHGGTLNGGSVDTGERLTAICREWAQRKRNNKAFVVELDDDDRNTMEEAMAKRESWDVMPDDSQSCKRGALLAEICRGWLERLDHDEAQRKEETPQFRAGGYYRTKTGGDLIGPIKGPDEMHAADWETLTSMLEPGEIVAWKHPGLRAGEYWWDGRLLKCGGMIVLNQLTSHHIADWINPPKIGRYTVPGGGKPATWEGDA